MEFVSWGVMGDWENPYTTMDPNFVKKQVQLFYQMMKEGYIYQRYMPVYWSPSSKTALAESELEYNDQHKSTAVYVRFKVKNASPATVFQDGTPMYLLIWTTTPWSLVANRAICYNPQSEYCIVKHPTTNERYIVASELLHKNKEMKAIFGEHPSICDCKFQTSDLLSFRYTSPITDEEMPVLPGSHVTMESGTGLVHTAPAHGQDDYLVGIDNGLDLSCSVDENGCYDSNASSEFQGLPVLQEGNEKVLNVLEEGEHILAKNIYTHSYPYDWRTKQPVLLRASKQLFMDTQTLQPKALEALKDVNIHPISAAKGFHGILEKRPYWCISRQRVWGVPIPLFYDENGNAIISEEMIDRFCYLVDQHRGADFWWEMETKELLKELKVDICGVNLTKSKDILDVWFDSGITWHNVIEVDKDGIRQSEVYLEGLDQFSGWFYSSLLTSVAVQGIAPYKQLYVHGFTMDEEGRKMSKSLGNVVSPTQITRGLLIGDDDAAKDTKLKKKPQKKATIYGVDVLRLEYNLSAKFYPRGIL